MKRQTIKWALIIVACVVILAALLKYILPLAALAVIFLAVYFIIKKRKA